MTFKAGDLVRPREFLGVQSTNSPIGLVEYTYKARGNNKDHAYVKVMGYGIAFRPYELKMVSRA
jgi:hypothetical protein